MKNSKQIEALYSKALKKIKDHFKTMSAFVVLFTDLTDACRRHSCAFKFNGSHNESILDPAYDLTRFMQAVCKAWDGEKGYDDENPMAQALTEDAEELYGQLWQSLSVYSWDLSQYGINDSVPTRVFAAFRILFEVSTIYREVDQLKGQENETEKQRPAA